MQKSKQILSIMTSGVVVVTGGYALMRHSESNQFRRSEKIPSNEAKSDQNERSQSANETSHLSINRQETNDKTNKKTKSHELKDASSTSINLSQLNSIESSNDLNATELVEDPTTLSSLKNDKSLKTSDDSLAQSAKLEKTLEKKKSERSIESNLVQSVVSAKGKSLVQSELPEAIVTEKGESLVQPELPEYTQPISIKGESLVQPELPEFTLIKTIKAKTETIRPPYVRMPDMKLLEGETRESFPGVEGKVEKEVEEYTSLDGKVYLTKVLSEKRTDPIVRVERYGTMKAGEEPGKVGVNDAYEHFPNADFAEMRTDVKLTAEEIRALPKEEIYSRAKGQYSNTINEVGKPGFYTVRIAPAADKVIDGLNSGTDLDHNLLSEEMLRLVNEERVKIGRQPLKWSNALYDFAKVRSAELASNGHIRFFNEKNEAMPHTRDATGKKWYTVFADTKYANDIAGENTAGYAMSRNVYSMFSEKFIAEELFEQWKNSRGHYENMISEDYKYFGFSVQFSKFWRFDKDKIDYFFKGSQGVQLFGGDSFKD